MEVFSQSHKNLQMFCADFWTTAEDCQLILSDVGVDSKRINLAEPAIMRWYSIIRELMRKNDGSMARLVVVLMKQYPENQALRDVCAPWIPATPAKTSSVDVDATLPPGAVLVKKFEAESGPEPKTKPKPEPAPKLVPVAVPEDFAEDAPLTVARIDTLWAAMVDTENRLREIEEWRNSLFARQSSPAKKKGG